MSSRHYACREGVISGGAVLTAIIVSWFSGNIDFSILPIAVEQFTLCKCLRDVNMISVHIALRSDDE